MKELQLLTENNINLTCTSYTMGKQTQSMPNNRSIFIVVDLTNIVGIQNVS